MAALPSQASPWSRRSRLVAVRVDRPDDSATPPPPTPSASTPAAADPAAGRRPAALADRGGRAAAARPSCPLLSTAPLRRPTGLTVLVGGAGLRAVDLDTGRVRPYAGVGQDGLVLQLAAAAGQVHALRTTCTAIQELGTGAVLRVDVAGRSASTVLPSGTDTLLTAPDATWALRYAGDPTGRQLVLRPLDGGDKVRLPMGFDVAHGHPAGVLRQPAAPGAPAPDGGFELAAVSRTDLHAGPHVGHRLLLAATERFRVTAGAGCGLTGRCVLTRVDTAGGSLRRYPLPAGRAPTSAGGPQPGRAAAGGPALPAGARPALRLSGTPAVPPTWRCSTSAAASSPSYPASSSAPKTQAGLAFDSRSRWLVIAARRGSRGSGCSSGGRGLSRPMASAARLPGAVYTVPVLVLDADT